MPSSLTHFRRLCLRFRVDFGLGFGLCFYFVWVLAFVLVFQDDFGLGFGFCLHFGFVFWGWVSASLYILGWLFLIYWFQSRLLIFLVFLIQFLLIFLLFLFCSSLLVLDGFWSQWWCCGYAVVSMALTMVVVVFWLLNDILFYCIFYVILLC